MPDSFKLLVTHPLNQLPFVVEEIGIRILQKEPFMDIVMEAGKADIRISFTLVNHSVPKTTTLKIRAEKLVFGITEYFYDLYLDPDRIGEVDLG